MKRLDEMTRSIGLPPWGEMFLAQTGIAAALAALALLAGWMVRRRFGAVLAEWVHGRDLGAQGPLTARAGPLAGWLVTLLLAAIALAMWPWAPFAQLVLGLAVAVAIGAAVRNLVLGVGLGTLAAAAAAAIVFAGVAANALGGFDALRGRLDAVGFTVGTRHFSVLSLLTIVLTVLVLFTVVRIANRLVRRVAIGSGDLDPTQQLLVEKIAGVAIIVAAFFIGIDLLGIDLTAFAVFSGALGLAVGFGLQKTFGNLIAGIILLMDRSIKPGDVIVVGDAVGRVNKIGVRAVSVITRDGKEHLVPNELLMTERVENWSYSSRDIRVRMAVGVSYECDLRLAQRLMVEAAKEAPRVLNSPEPVCWITAFGDSSVEHELRIWISDPESGLGNVQGDVFLRIWDKFNEAGIAIPYPQRDVHVRGTIDLPTATGPARKPKPR